ncbi:MAG: NUDIX domain-containing protein [Pseudomonadota bacterium]
MVSDLRTALFRMWFRVSRPVTLGVRGLVENTEGQVLLVRHTYIAGLYFPGGGVEKAESAGTALERELIEEAGIAVTAAPDLHGIYSNHKTFKNDHVLLYRVRSWRSVPATSHGEISEIVWCDPQTPPDDATPATKRRLSEIYRAAPRSDHW